MTRKLSTTRMPFWRELKWYLAQRLLGLVIDLAGNEMSADTLAKFVAFQESFIEPDPQWNTVRMRPTTVAGMFEQLVRDEYTTTDPQRAQAAVMQLDGHVRLVVDRLFAREGDIAHVRGTAGFDQMLRYWRIERSENEVRAAAEQAMPWCETCGGYHHGTAEHIIVREFSSDPMVELARLIGQNDPFLASRK